MEEYIGYKEVCMPDEDAAKIYNNQNEDTFGCLQNEYLIAKNENGEDNLGLFKYSDDKFVTVPFKTINNNFIGKVKPRNVQQQLALDMLYDPSSTVKVITGKFGTGELFAPLHSDMYSKSC